MALEASVRFLKWSPLYEKERPFQIFMDLLPDAQDHRKTNLSWDEKSIFIEDFRENGDLFQLDTHGFTSRQLPGFQDLLTREVIQQRYIPAVKQMLREELSQQQQQLGTTNGSGY